MLVTLFASVFWKLTGLGLLYLLGGATNQWRHTLLLLCPGAVIEGAIGVWIYRWLEKYDWVTFKSARAEHLLEDELVLDHEGL